MPHKPLLQTLSQTKSRLPVFWPKLNWLKWEYLAAILLGIAGNYLVNLAFDLKYQRNTGAIDLEEYYLAIFVSLLLLAINRGLTDHQTVKRVEKTLKWPPMVFWTSLYTMSSLIVLNLLVVGVTYAFYQSFYVLEDLLLISICFVPLTAILTILLRKQPVKKHGRSTRQNQWIWVSSLLLGIGVNTLINLIFDYKFQRPLISASVEEYLNAILASYLLLSGMRWIGQRLDKRYPWKSGVIKRLTIQLGSQFVFIVFALNVLVVSITYFVYGGFYSFDELMVINISMLLLTSIFSGIDSSIYFYQNWKSATSPQLPTDSEHSRPIQVTLGKTKLFIKQREIDYAFSKSGLTLIFTKQGRKLPYSQSLEQLHQKLNAHLFFRVNRQVILNRGIIKSFKTLPYGKLEVEVSKSDLTASPIHISRTRATHFKKWLQT